MSDDRLREVLRGAPAPPQPDFERMVLSRRRHARMGPTLPIAATMVTLALVVTFARPRGAPPPLPSPSFLVEPVGSPLPPGPDVLEGQRIAEHILSLRASEVNR